MRENADLRHVKLTDIYASNYLNTITERVFASVTALLLHTSEQKSNSFVPIGVICILPDI